MLSEDWGPAHQDKEDVRGLMAFIHRSQWSRACGSLKLPVSSVLPAFCHLTMSGPSVSPLGSTAKMSFLYLWCMPSHLPVGKLPSCSFQTRIRSHHSAS